MTTISTDTDIPVLELDLHSSDVTVVVGRTGSGKTTFARGVALAALAAGGTVLVSDRMKHGVDYEAGFDGSRITVATDMNSTLTMLNSVAAEIDRRRDVFQKHGVHAASELPPEAQLDPWVVIIENFQNITRGPQFEEHEASAQPQCSFLLADLVLNPKYGVTMILTSQSFTAPDAEHLPGLFGAGNHCAALLLSDVSEEERLRLFLVQNDITRAGVPRPRGTGIYDRFGDPHLVTIPFN